MALEGSVASEDDRPIAPLVFESFYWGLLSAISLNIGSLIGVTCLPSTRVRAILMSFGGGALLFALSIELFGHVLHVSEAENSTAPVWVMEGSAVVGGLFFATLNYALNVLGADLRKPSTTKSRFARLRALLMRRLAWRLSKIPFFSVLTLEDLKDLIQYAMYKQRFRPGDIIMSGDAGDEDIFFILSGEVRVEICGKEEPTSPLHPSPPESGRKLGRQLLRGRSMSNGWTTDLASHMQPLHEWQLGPNQIFGDMTVLTGSYLSCVATAVTHVKVLVLPGHEVARLLDVNDAVRDQVAMRAVHRLRQVAELQHLSDHALAPLAASCSLVRYQKGETVFHGEVTAETPIICLVLGSIEVTHQEGGRRRTLHASRLFCTEHLRCGINGPHFTAKALEETSVLIISREDINLVTNQGENISIDKESDDEDVEKGVSSVRLPPLPGQAQESAVVVDLGAPQERSVKLAPLGRKPRELEPLPATKPAWIAVRKELPPGQPLGTDRSWAHLGWDDDGTEADEAGGEVGLGVRLTALSVGQVTDVELAEQELELSRTPRRRGGSKRSSVPPSSHVGEPATKEAGGPDSAGGPSKAPDAHEPLVATKEGAARHRAVMVWLGILIDAVPESLVIGIIINKSAAGSQEGDDLSLRAASAALPFVMGVFISNLPESMSSSGSMKAHGVRVPTILLMWLATTILTATGSSLGAVLFPPGSSDGGTGAAELAIVAVEGLAAGAMLTMIAQTMLPEAFEQGGDVVGLSCLAGFLCALSVKLIPIGQ